MYFFNGGYNLTNISYENNSVQMADTGKKLQNSKGVVKESGKKILASVGNADSFFLLGRKRNIPRCEHRIENVIIKQVKKGLNICEAF